VGIDNGDTANKIGLVTAEIEKQQLRIIAEYEAFR
jgi:hypothetical protein